MVPCHNCCIYGTWRSREVEEEDHMEVIIWIVQATKVGISFYGGNQPL